MCAPSPLAILIEDDADAADALKLLLADWGAETIAGSRRGDILAALEVRESAVRWIIADYDLGPGPTGIALARELSRTLPEARVLVLTGALSERADRDAKDAGYKLMRKPASAAAIINWLEGAPS